MVRYQIILAYDGSNFVGSQKQANSRTVQGELEKALQQIGWAGTSVLMAGRTDTGVHASGQVAAFDFDEWKYSTEKLLQAMNAKLPHDLVVKKMRVTNSEFHPRFDAVSRTYRYRLFYKKIRDPLREKFEWHVRTKFDEEALKESASLFLGTHDFSSFGSKTTENGTAVRTVTKSEWKKKPKNEWHFFISNGKKNGVCSSVAGARKMLAERCRTGFIKKTSETSIRACACTWVNADRSKVLKEFRKRRDERATKNILSESR
jgi:tRNA pseudouridine38-40 synthase